MQHSFMMKAFREIGTEETFLKAIENLKQTYLVLNLSYDLGKLYNLSMLQFLHPKNGTNSNI